MTPAPSPVASRPLVPRDAATLILVDRAGSEPRILMGRRRSDLAFLPDKYVFPGGRVDPADRMSRTGGELATAVVDKLVTRMRGRATVGRAHALARAALRETREETGLSLTHPSGDVLQYLSFIARAVTPPGRPRRYDTRFFLADAELARSSSIAGDGELAGIGWFALAEIRSLDLPGITRLVIEDVAQIASREATAVGASVPFYYHRAGRFHRELI